jgi:PAS domain S-box-containing protein
MQVPTDSRGDSPAVPPDELDTLRAIVEGTAVGTGEEFFRSLVRNLAQAIGVRYSFVAEFTPDGKVRPLAYWFRDRFREPGVEWDIAGTPCEDVVRGRICHYPRGVAARFPADTPLTEWGIESYLGVPLPGPDGRHLGHLAVFGERPLPDEPRLLYTFRIFASRAAAELERLRTERLLRQSEERFRELYEEAPNAYVSTGTDGRLIHVNKRAAEMTGRPVAELIGFRRIDLFADTPAGKPRAAEVFARFLRGEPANDVEMEMARKDGRPLWISLSMKPVCGPDGELRACWSIWVDITERVLAEQERARLQQQNQYLQEEIKSDHNFEEIVGRSPALMGALDGVAQVAPTDSTVLITGETGTGKELIARAVHSASRRRERPLIKVNCAALPAGLVESELFGHEKGAFTGAIARRTGRFELAEGGTLFLDEIGELPADAQAKLLRVLQEREFERVGGSAPVKADVRIIAATNRDLSSAVREKAFRADLFYRLNVFPIRLPPLRERAGDLPLLAHFLASRSAARLGKRIEAIAPDTLARMAAYPWPGNVRELENILERAVILARGTTLEVPPEMLMMPEPPAAAPALPAQTPGAVPTTPAAPSSSPAGGENLEAVERRHILEVLARADWVIDGPRGAAKVLGLHPNTLRSRLKRLGIARPASGSAVLPSHDPS